MDIELRAIVFLDTDTPARVKAIETGSELSSLLTVLDLATDDDTSTQSLIDEVDKRLETSLQ